MDTMTMQAAGEPKALLTVKEVAEWLGCSVKHVWRQADAGRMPRPVKFGGLTRWRRNELQTWIDGGCRPVR